jgi:hypothetical protein
MRAFELFIATFFRGFGEQNFSCVGIFGQVEAFEDGVGPDKIPSCVEVEEDDMRVFVLAHVHIARLSAKLGLFSPGGNAERIETLETSLERHRWILEFARRVLPLGSNARRCVVEELDLCRQSTELLPLQIMQLRG